MWDGGVRLAGRLDDERWTIDDHSIVDCLSSIAATGEGLSRGQLEAAASSDQAANLRTLRAAARCAGTATNTRVAPREVVAVYGRPSPWIRRSIALFSASISACR